MAWKVSSWMALLPVLLMFNGIRIADSGTKEPPITPLNTPAIIATIQPPSGTPNPLLNKCHESRCVKGSACPVTANDSNVLLCLTPPEICARYCYSTKPSKDSANRIAPDSCNEVEHITSGMKVTSICPKYGPMAGGTIVNIWGQNLDNSDVSLGGEDCTVLYKSSAMIQCITGARYRVDNEPVKLTLIKNGVTHKYPAVYEYKKDPVVDSMEPKQANLKGGVHITVKGKNLYGNALYVIKIAYDVERNNRAYIYESVTASTCVIESTTKMVCKSPSVKLPREYLDKNYTWSGDLPADGEDQGTLIYRHSKGNSGRRRRATEIKDENLEVLAFLNLGGPIVSIGHDGDFALYENPKLDKFEDDMEFWPEFPDLEDEIELKGTNLNAGTMSDYTVKIGDKKCVVTDLSSTKLVCEPPKDRPGEDAPEVVVEIGEYKETLGKLYYRGTWDNEKFKYGLIAAGAVVALIILIAICLCLVRRSNSGDKDVYDNHPRGHHQSSIQRNGHAYYKENAQP